MKGSQAQQRLTYTKSGAQYQERRMICWSFPTATFMEMIIIRLSQPTAWQVRIAVPYTTGPL